MSDLIPPAVFVALSSFVSCGTTAENADVLRGLYAGIEPRQDIAPIEHGRVVEGLASRAGPSEQVSGVSCKTSWSPEPSESNAIELMKRQAKEAGFTSVHSVPVKSDPSAIAKSCCSSIVATGVAFNS